MFRQALELNPQSLFAHLYLARLAIQADDMDQAEVWYSKALAINWSVELSLEVAEFYGSRKEYAKVEHQYREIMSQYPDDTRASLGLIHSLVLQNKKTEAITELQHLRKKSSDPSQIDIFTARLHLRSGETEKAAQLLESVVSQGDEPEAIYMLAVILYQEKEVVRAMELLETINQQSDYYEDSLYLRVRILLDRNKKMEAVTLIKKNMNSGMASDPDLYSLLASLYVELNREQEGYDIMASGIEQYPENPNLHYEYGLLLERGDRQEEAVVQMQKVLELVPDHAEALNYIGYTWANKNINLKQALEYIERALKLKPESGYILDSLGWIYFRMGELEKAEREILKALEQN
ncbi:MAG: tetratricopeptide repeat protein, partial [Candidatus Fermentibacteria bacterium]